MTDIHEQCLRYGVEADGYINYMKGANIAGFMKAAEKFVFDALGGDNLYPVGITAYRLECFGIYVELQLRGEAYCTEHSQRVVAERYVGVERCADYTPLYVGEAVETVYHLAEAVAVYLHGKRVDSEVAPCEVFFESAVLHYGISRIAAVGLAAGTHELKLEVGVAHLRRAVIAVNGQRRMAAEPLRHSLGKLYARAHGDEIDVFRGASYDNVAHIAAHGVAFAPHTVGYSADGGKNLLVE